MSYIKLWLEILLSIVTVSSKIYIKRVPMNFHGTEKKWRKGSHDLWERNRKIVYQKMWNPRACNDAGCIILNIRNHLNARKWYNIEKKNPIRSRKQTMQLAKHLTLYLLHVNQRKDVCVFMPGSTYMYAAIIVYRHTQSSVFNAYHVQWNTAFMVHGKYTWYTVRLYRSTKYWIMLFNTEHYVIGGIVNLNYTVECCKMLFDTFWTKISCDLSIFQNSPSKKSISSRHSLPGEETS